MQNWQPINHKLSFKALCKKVASLFMILGAGKKQGLMVIDITNVILEIGKLYWYLIKLSNRQTLKIF